jgi:hypothetical protein
MLRFFTAIAAAVLLMLTVAGCGDGAGEGTGPTTSKAAPGVPTSKGGDNSIQTYGREAGSPERARAAVLVRAYLEARAAEDWEKACSYLAARQRRELELLAGRSLQLAHPSCAAAEASLVTPGSKPALRAEARIHVLSLRLDGSHAFLIYKRPDERFYATALSREGGRWKVFSVAPAPLG